MSAPRLALGTFSTSDAPPFPGLILDDVIYPAIQLIVHQGLDCPRSATMIDLLEGWDEYWPALRKAAADIALSAEHVEAFTHEDLRVHIPIQPRQIVCSGANYRRHVIEIMTDHEAASAPGLTPAERHARAVKLMDHRAQHGQPFAFMKPVSALMSSRGDLPIPADSHQADWELELAVVIGRPTYRVSQSEALGCVAGYTIANDISARDRIARPDFPSLGLDWVAAKGAPGFLPLGPYIVPADLIDDPQRLDLKLTLNGRVMQDESTKDMIFPVARLIEFISTYMRLLPGDVICTGSPAGNGTHYDRYLRPGDVLDGSISGLGAQHVRCVAEELPALAALHRPFVPLPQVTS